MANLIDKSVFVGDISLSKSQYDAIDTFIVRFEPIALINLLGLPLYQLWKDNVLNEPYKGLGAGSDYIIKVNNIDVTMKYPGFKGIITYFVYCEYLKNQVTSTQSVGEVKSKQENSYNATVNQKLFSAWVKFEELYGYPGQSKTIPSAYNYLTAKKELFPLWIFTELRGSMNSHDL